MSSQTNQAIANSESSGSVTKRERRRSASFLKEKIDLHTWAMIALAECEGETTHITRAIEWHGGCIKEYALELAEECRRKGEGK